MTQPLNYTTKAIDDLGDLARSYPKIGRSPAGIEFLIAKLKAAQVFVLPDGGELLDRSKSRAEVPGAILHPPFPVVALEYCTSARMQHDPFYEASACPKRIALCWEWDGVLPADMSRVNAPPAGSGVVIASIAFYNEYQQWIPIMGAAMIDYEPAYAPPTDLPHRAALVRSGRISPSVAGSDAMCISQFMPLLSDAFGDLVRERSTEAAIDMMTADLMDELNAYHDLSVALACHNVRSALVKQPEKLNRARIRRGDLPLKDFHVLEIGGDRAAGRGVAFENGAGVRPHLRRGHIRRLGADRLTWVSATMVRGRQAGFVEKHYSVAAAG